MGVISTRPHGSCSTVPAPASPVRPARPAGGERCFFIRTAATCDLSATARLHAAYLPIGFFPRLGPRFLSRWHAAFLDSPHAIGLVAVERDRQGDEDVIGFLVGTSDQPAFRTELLHCHRFALARYGVLALAARPRVLVDFFRSRAASYATRLWSRPTPAADDPQAAGRERAGELTAIAVSERFRSSGVGRRLTDTYLSRCAAMGVPWVELATATEPDTAVRFYERTGWVPLRRSRTRDGVTVAHFGRYPTTDAE